MPQAAGEGRSDFLSNRFCGERDILARARVVPSRTSSMGSTIVDCSL